MGMELASTVIDDAIPSTGDPFPYLHLFFRLGDGSTMAFFESPGLPPAAGSSHPAYDIFNHIAFEVDASEGLHRWHDWHARQGFKTSAAAIHTALILRIHFNHPHG